jgi:hypothetical protein
MFWECILSPQKLDDHGQVFTDKGASPGFRAAGEKNCRQSISSSLVKYKINCRYLLMTFRKRMRKKKFSKNCFHTLQGTMFHRPLTNTSSLKITEAYCAQYTIFKGFPHILTTLKTLL